MDIQSYVRHPASHNLFVVVVDAVRDIPDPRQFEAELTGTQKIDGRRIEVQVIVCEP